MTLGFIGEALAAVYPFKVGVQYTRQDVFGILGISDPAGGNWYTGYNSHGDDWFIRLVVGWTMSSRVK